MTALFAIFARVAVVYLFLLLLLRLSGKRTIGKSKPMDLITAFVISDVPDNIIYGTAPLAQGMVALTTLVGVHLGLGWLATRHSFWRRVAGSTPAVLLLNGVVARDTQARERISDDELDSLLREQRLARREDVAVGVLEPSGRLSIRRRSS